MKTTKKVQAVIYTLHNDKPYFLILHRTLRWKGWELMKETIKKGETPLQTLKRGIKEETHLTKYTITKKLNKTHTWKKNNTTYKIIAIYHVKVDAKHPIQRDHHEHDKHLWTTKNRAYRLLTYTNTRNLIKTFKP